MKKSIIISLLIAWASNIFPCTTMGTHNYYLFNTIDKSDWSQSVQQRTLENWRTYAGADEMYWFNADEMRQIAQQKGDALMMTYIDHLKKYLDICSATQETWNYPTKKELLNRRQTLLSIQKYAFSKTKTRLRSQHALLYMRCNMMLDMHQKNITFWEQTASKFINSVYRDMMRNIYAGALLKSNRADEATQVFVEQGDIASLYTYYYKKRSCQAIKAEYEANPNSPAFPFLLQDFANNAQEAYDCQQDSDNIGGKLFIRDITLQENQQMSQFCEQVVRAGKTDNPVLWQSLRAWLLYLSGQRLQALKVIQGTTSLSGSNHAKDNAHVLRLFIYASEAPMNADFDKHLAQELNWLEQKSKETNDGPFLDNHYSHVFDRLVHQVLIDRYTAASRPETGIAFLGAYDEQPKIFSMMATNTTERYHEGDWNGDYSGDFFWHLDTIAIHQAEQYFAYTQQTPSTEIDHWLSTRIRHDNNFFHELLGTKYLRQGLWQKAINHLEKISLDYINTMNIVPFMARRDYHVEPWMKRQRIKQELQMPGTICTSENQKLTFAQEMLSLEQGFGTMEPGAKARRAYQLATLYTQASYAGDCWYLTRYGKSCMDSPRADEQNMLQKASSMLTSAQYLSDFLWREKIFYAQAWLPIDSWYTEEWNEKNFSYEIVPQTRSRQFRALYTLARYENDNASQTSGYVSRCDVLRQFRKRL